MDVTSKEAEIYIEAIKLAENNNQVIGEKNDYYITIRQLEALLLGNYEQ